MKDRLSEKEKREIAEIVSLCNAQDGTEYSVPLEADGYYLSKSGAVTVSFLAFFELGETYDGIPVDEICAFTHPLFRGKGRMRRLLGKCREDYETGEYVWKFQADPRGNARSYLLHLSCSHEYDELLMKKELAPSGSISSFTEETGIHFENEHSELFANVEGVSAYLYDVRSDASHLREGSAERLLKKALRELSDICEIAVLEVSSQNLPALRLYEKTGFTVAERLEMWYHKSVND